MATWPAIHPPAWARKARVTARPDRRREATGGIAADGGFSRGPSVAVIVKPPA